MRLRSLGVALTGFKGLRKSAEINFYDDQTTDIILDQMDASRAEVMLDFITNKKDADIDQYPIEAAFKDIFKYFTAGTQTEAFRKIRQTTAATASIREKQVLKLPSIDAGQVFNGSIDVTKATISIGRSLDNFRKIYADWVAAGKPAPDATYDPGCSPNLRRYLTPRRRAHRRLISKRTGTRCGRAMRRSIQTIGTLRRPHQR